jgi:hypothetical protein
MFNFSDKFFKNVEKKTNIDKDTIINLAKKLQANDLKNEDTLKDVIKELSALTGKNVTNEQEEKILNAVKNDNVPKNVDKMF